MGGEIRTAKRGAIAYVGTPLPQRSQTFVYREMLGLRGRGWDVVPVTVGPPERGDPEIDAVADEVLQVYSAPTALALIPALIAMPRQAAQAVADAFRADLPSVGARIKFLFKAWMGLAASLRLRGRGIVHVHAHMANTPTSVALYLARGLGAGFSFTGHANDLFVHREALRFKLGQAAFTPAISHWHRHFYDEIAGPGVRPVIRCSVALPALGDGAGRDVVAVGRLVAKKGFDLLIRALARLDRPDLRLWLAGDGPERAALEALAASEGVSDRVEFLGSRPHAECLDLIAEGAIFALPCRTSATGDRDGIPVVLMEAMARAKPVIAGRLESIAELVEDGTSGILVPPDDVDALAAALDRLAGDAALRETMGLAGRRRVEEEFSDAVNWDRLERAFETAMDEAGAR